MYEVSENCAWWAKDHLFWGLRWLCKVWEHILAEGIDTTKSEDSPHLRKRQFLLLDSVQGAYCNLQPAWLNKQMNGVASHSPGLTLGIKMNFHIACSMRLKHGCGFPSLNIMAFKLQLDSQLPEGHPYLLILCPTSAPPARILMMPLAIFPDVDPVEVGALSGNTNHFIILQVILWVFELDYLFILCQQHIAQLELSEWCIPSPLSPLPLLSSPPLCLVPGASLTPFDGGHCPLLLCSRFQDSTHHGHVGVSSSSSRCHGFLPSFLLFFVVVGASWVRDCDHSAPVPLWGWAPALGKICEIWQLHHRSVTPSRLSLSSVAALLLLSAVFHHIFTSCKIENTLRLYLSYYWGMKYAV